MRMINGHYLITLRVKPQLAETCTKKIGGFAMKRLQEHVSRTIQETAKLWLRPLIHSAPLCPRELNVSEHSSNAISSQDFTTRLFEFAYIK